MSCASDNLATSTLVDTPIEPVAKSMINQYAEVLL
jgi:hypothetical protein